ncbi:UbiH/UbiF family hydroxylase [Rhizobium sp. C4]|uniref:UbiH/UbiF family hydroxylase n=1 Tax=Rhizobium sp. C4 TaxID=1349800 RepID=UPI001E564E32|nr:UbiH/UbiF family hydroxylase [Rhizobium sp. C4]MCD2171435.1 UbiH/UbiF family hydroxylase [Rhizobium sp. C4]
MERFDIAVAGNGLAGRIAAIALSRLGYSVALIGPAPENQDGRTTALMDQSIAFLEGLGVWGALSGRSAALKTMQIIDGTGRLFRAPTVPFRASEIGLGAFGYNFPNSAALEVLGEIIGRDDNIHPIEGRISGAEFRDDAIVMTLDDGRVVEAGFVAAADGRKSVLREAAGIAVRRWSYPQTAVVLNFAHTIPHGNVSTEFHTPTGPFTQVPLPGARSSLVWVQASAEAEAFLALSNEDISLRIETRMQSMLGKVTVDGKPQGWPLSGMTASRFGKGRLALIGEASHAFPPIGAQGLNLSLRDIIALCDLLGMKRDHEGPSAVGDAFDRSRRPDVLSRTASVDLLNRSLLSNFLPVQLVRAAGLHLLELLPPLRNLVMQEGVAPGRGLRGLSSGLREKIARKHA